MATTATPILTCEKCHAPGMKPTRIPRFSGVVRLLGVLFMLPSLLGMALVSGGWVTTVAQSAGRADLADVAVGGLGFAFVIITFFLGIPSFLIGLLLVSTKKVWRCTQCHYVFDRA